MGSVTLAELELPTAPALERALAVARWALADVQEALGRGDSYAALSRSVRVEDALANVLALVRKGVR